MRMGCSAAGGLIWAGMLLTTPALAGPHLIAALDIDATKGDLSVNTAAPLENGVAGNLLGGIGSGMAFAGGDTFVMLPDRGPNAVSYNAVIDNTASYVPRFQTFRFVLTPQKAGLPFRVEARLSATTLLWSTTPLAYGDGVAAHAGSGVPALNGKNRYYFSGRSDDFDPARDSGFDGDARLDPESVRVAGNGQSVFISDEYGPYIYRFDRATGRRIQSFKIPDSFTVKTLSAHGDDEVSGNRSGRIANRGMEGLAISPDGGTLTGIMQSPLIQDGGFNGGVLRLLSIDIATGATKQYAYPLDNAGKPDKPKYNAVSEILAVDAHEFLIDERDGKGRGAGSAAGSKLIYLIDTAGAQEVSGISGEAALQAAAMPKHLFIDLTKVLRAGGVAPETVPAKIEGMSFGPDVTLKGQRLHTLWIASDNDFLSTADGAPNPNTVYVIAFDDADLPGYVAQRLARPAK